MVGTGVDMSAANFDTAIKSGAFGAFGFTGKGGRWVGGGFQPTTLGVFFSINGGWLEVVRGLRECFGSWGLVVAMVDSRVSYWFIY